MLFKSYVKSGRYLMLKSHYYTKSLQSKKNSIGIIGVPFAKGQGKLGVELAPNVLRKSSLIDELSKLTDDLTVRDYGNLVFNSDVGEEGKNLYPCVKHFSDFMDCSKALIHKVQEILKENDKFLAIGGDHAIGFGSVAGHLQHNPNLSLIWVDAHADVNLHSTSMSGHIHGMPVSCLLKELRKYWQNASLNKIAPNCLAADQLIYIGLRDVDPYEAYFIKNLGIKAYGMKEIDKHGIGKIIEMSLDAISPYNKIHVSFDVDALDISVAPSTGTIVEGGLTLREGIAIVESLQETNRVEGIDLVEFNPMVGSENDVKTTINTCISILKYFCGYKRSGKVPNELLKDDLQQRQK